MQRAVSALTLGKVILKEGIHPVSATLRVRGLRQPALPVLTSSTARDLQKHARVGLRLSTAAKSPQIGRLNSPHFERCAVQAVLTWLLAFLGGLPRCRVGHAGGQALGGRHEVGVLSLAVAGALDVHDDSVVQQPVEQGGGDDGVPEDLTPFGKAAVGGQDHRAALVAGVDQLEQQVPCGGAEREVADLVDDEQLGPAQIADALAQPTLAIGLSEAVDDVGERREVDAASGADRLHAQGDGEVGLAGAGLADEVDHFVAIDELQLRQGEDAVAVQRRLEREVEAADGLDRGEPGDLQGRLDAAALAHSELLGKQGVDCLDGADRTALELLDDTIQRLQGTWHAQADEVLADALDRRAWRDRGHHAAVPLLARRLPTAS